MYEEVKNNCDPGYIQIGNEEVCNEWSDVCRHGADLCVPLTNPQCLASHKVCAHEETFCSDWSNILTLGLACVSYKTVCASWKMVCDEWLTETCSFVCDVTDKVCEGLPEMQPVCIPDPSATCR